MQKLSLFLVPAILTVSLAAQTPLYNVSPQGMANQTLKQLDPGLWNSTHGNATYMQIHSGLPKTNRILLNEISFRRGTYPVGYKAFSPKITLKVSTPVTSPSTAKATFAANHGIDLTTVINQTTVNFPATSWVALPPFQYNMKFTGTKPFVYKQSGRLCWELRIHSGNGTSTNWMDAIDGNRGSKGVNFGPGCNATGLATPPIVQSQIDSMSASTWGLKTLVANLTSSQPYICLIGNQKLNLDLTFLGGKGCSLHTNPLCFLSGMTMASGAVTTYYVTPLTFQKSPAMAGMSLFTQWMALDPGKPGLPLAMSCGTELAIPGTAELARITSKNNPTATTGTVENGSGLIIRFTFN